MEKSNSRAWIGALLLIIGAFFLLRNTDILPYYFLYDIRFWPAIMTAVGIIIILHSRNSFLGYVLLLIGGALIASDVFDVSFRYIWREYWPLALIALGIYFLVRKGSLTNANNHPNTPWTGPESEDVGEAVDITAILNTVKRKIVSQNFKGGKITALFGGTNLDLREAKLAEGKNILDVVIIFGGLNIIVKNDMKVDVNAPVIFGGISDKRVIDPNQVQNHNSILEVRGVILFGGGDIKGYA
ncbi:MAG: DUF5668 domain-containing protein [Ignavibacteria bacterium]|jgi:predicted membrane protein